MGQGSPHAQLDRPLEPPELALPRTLGASLGPLRPQGPPLTCSKAPCLPCLQGFSFFMSTPLTYPLPMWDTPMSPSPPRNGVDDGGALTEACMAE